MFSFDPALLKFNYNNIFSDEDFCLYKDFPFQQLAIVYISPTKILNQLENNTSSTITCTTIWLIQYYPLFATFDDLFANYFDDKQTSILTGDYLKNNLSVQCNFQKRLAMCQKTTTTILNVEEINQVELKMRISYVHSILIFTCPVISTLGLITNILVVVTIHKYRNSDEMKKKRHYDFMQINSASNCCLCCIDIMSLMNACSYEFWCSSISYLEGIQYFKIIVGQFLRTSFRFVSNFTHVGFTLSRLSLIGQEDKHGWLVTRISNPNHTSMRHLLALITLVSVLLSVVKLFVYTLNKHTNDDRIFQEDTFSDLLQLFPIRLTVNAFFFKEDNTRTIVVNVFDCISDCLNYPLFGVVNLGVDVYTSVLFKRTLEEKMKNVHNDVVRKRKEEENADAIGRTNRMVVTNMVADLFLKLPLVILPLFQILNNFSNTDMAIKEGDLVFGAYLQNDIVYFCSELNGCELVDELLNSLFALSISLTILFYYKFDANFKICFRKMMFKNEPINKSKTKQQN